MEWNGKERNEKEWKGKEGKGREENRSQMLCQVGLIVVVDTH